MKDCIANWCEQTWHDLRQNFLSSPSSCVVVCKYNQHLYLQLPFIDVVKSVQLLKQKTFFWIYILYGGVVSICHRAKLSCWLQKWLLQFCWWLWYWHSKSIAKSIIDNDSAYWCCLPRIHCKECPSRFNLLAIVPNNVTPQWDLLQHFYQLGSPPQFQFFWWHWHWVLLCAQCGHWMSLL